MKKITLFTLLSISIISCSKNGKESYNWENGNLFLEMNFNDDVIQFLNIYYPNKELFCELLFDNGYLKKQTLHPYETNYIEEHYFEKGDIVGNNKKLSSKIYFNENLISDIFHKQPFNQIDSLSIYDSSFVRVKNFSGGEKVPKDLHIFNFRHLYLNEKLWNFLDELEMNNYKFDLKFFENDFKKINNELVRKLLKFENGFIKDEFQNNRQTPLCYELEKNIEKNNDIKYYIIHLNINGQIKESIPLKKYKSRMPSETFCIDGYTNEYDDQGNIVNKVKYINGLKKLF